MKRTLGILIVVVLFTGGSINAQNRKSAAKKSEVEKLKPPPPISSDPVADDDYVQDRNEAKMLKIQIDSICAVIPDSVRKELHSPCRHERESEMASIHDLLQIRKEDLATINTYEEKKKRK